MFKIFSKPTRSQIEEARRIQSETDKLKRKEYEERKLAMPATKPATKSTTPVTDQMIDKLKTIVAKHEAKKNKADNNPGEDIEPIAPLPQKPVPPPYHQPPTPEDRKVELPMTYTDTSAPYDPFPKSEKYEIVDVLANDPFASSPVYEIGGSYLLMYHDGRCYFQPVNARSAPVELRKASGQAISPYATYNLTKLDTSEPLTEEDLGVILKAKPAATELLNRFARYSCSDISIDKGRAAQVF